MAQLWSPLTNPPTVSKDAARDISAEFATGDTLKVINDARRLMHHDYEIIFLVVGGIGTICNEIFKYPHLERAMLAGAAIGGLAYRETGFFPDIDDTAIAASIDHIQHITAPEVFTNAAHSDIEMCGMLETAATSLSALDEGGIKQFMQLGAGCTRIFFGHALMAA